MLVALKGSAGPIRCAVAYYGPLDAYYKVASPLALLKPSSLPVLVAKAGRDTPTINRSIDRFVAKSRRLGARVELLVHPTGAHVFDASGDARSRAIVRRTLDFLRARLRR
jgi:dienelactone hydrolase